MYVEHTVYVSYLKFANKLFYYFKIVIQSMRKNIFLIADPISVLKYETLVCYFIK